MNQSDMEKLKKLLAGPQGKQLMELLSRKGDVRQAGQAANRGDMDRVRALMEPAVSDPEIQKLLRSLEQSMNHG